MTIATAQSWKHLPPPAVRKDLGFEGTFTAGESERLLRGLVPMEMEDKWFVYFEDEWLRFHRSWTGAFIYALRLERSGGGFRVAESWVNRDPQQYKGDDESYDRQLLRFLIDALLLGRTGAVFPMPRVDGNAPDGVVQHVYVGRAYPERAASHDDSDSPDDDS